MTKIVNGVFLVLFFNTGIILVLVQANLSDVSNGLSNVFDGPFYDYSPKWYASVGATIVSKMLLASLMPPIYESITKGQTWAMQVWDSGKWLCWNTGTYVRIYHTSKKQIYDLIDTYVGPSYLNYKHRKYSEMLNVTYVTMLYGLGLPMLFPIAFFTYFMYYTVERYHIAYTH